MTASISIDAFVIGTPPKHELVLKLREIGEKADRDINYISYPKKSFQNLKKKHSSFIGSVIEKSIEKPFPCRTYIISTLICLLFCVVYISITYI